MGSFDVNGGAVVLLDIDSFQFAGHVSVDLNSGFNSWMVHWMEFSNSNG